MNNEIIDSIQGTTIVLNMDDGKKKTFDISAIFNIDDSALAAEFTKQASLYAYFAVQAARAERNKAVADAAQEREYAMADQDFREEFHSKDEKFTEPTIKQMIMTDEAYVTSQNVAQAANYEFKLLKALATALEMRANMLISLGAYMRHEMDMTGMNIQSRRFSDQVEDVTQLAKEKIRKARENRQQK